MSFVNFSILDTFTRADGAPGSSWAGPSFGDPNNLTITSNAITSAANAFGAMCYIPFKVGSDYGVFMTLSTLPTAGKTSRVISSTDATSVSITGYYLVLTPSTGSWQIGDAATGGNIGSPMTQSFNAGDSFGFNRISGVITTWYLAAGGSWASIGSVTDARYGGPFYLGIEMEDNVQRAINFTGGNVVRNRKTLSGIGTRTGSRQMQAGAI